VLVVQANTLILVIRTVALGSPSEELVFEGDTDKDAVHERIHFIAQHDALQPQPGAKTPAPFPSAPPAPPFPLSLEESTPFESRSIPYTPTLETVARDRAVSTGPKP
jgi:hypothetical protein